MDYVVVVVGPVPEDLSSVAGGVAQRFKISEDKALALLRRAPGPVTKLVPEGQARTVAGILAEAGLNVELREGGVEGRPVPIFVPVTARTPEPSPRPADAREPVFDPRAEGLRIDPAPGRSGAQREHDDSTGDEGAGVTAPSETVDAPAAPPAEAPVTATDAAAVRSTQVPPAGKTTTTPPRDPMKTTLTREPPDLDRRGLRRRIATAATLPAVLTLLAALLVLTVTLLPVLRSQQVERARGTAAAVAATVEGLSGGLPLSSPVVRTQLGRAQDSAAQHLGGHGLAFLVVEGADGSRLLQWDDGAGELSSESARLVDAPVAEDAAGEASGDWLDSLRTTWESFQAVVGLKQAEPIVGRAQMVREGLPLGTVIVGVDASAMRDQLGRVLLSSLLVGLIPVLLAVLAATSLTRGITDAIRYLLVATDRISHGDLEQPVELQRDDELGQIARAVERMRISLREGMERLRRRR